jgi:hypothetical protein
MAAAAKARVDARKEDRAAVAAAREQFHRTKDSLNKALATATSDHKKEAIAREIDAARQNFRRVRKAALKRVRTGLLLLLLLLISV